MHYFVGSLSKKNIHNLMWVLLLVFWRILQQEEVVHCDCLEHILGDINHEDIALLWCSFLHIDVSSTLRMIPVETSFSLKMNIVRLLVDWQPFPPSRMSSVCSEFSCGCCR
ncbi:Otoferlin [Frankliniella fusca]|uniref:Otoferlin n=1 Tax=Frankliniella fusca TaxID=407009 RepID=A0AAE1LAC6_9NEOP|nr:Otoferlin [Frankliniella fusca]